MIFQGFLLLIFLIRNPRLKKNIIERKLLKKLPEVVNGQISIIKPDNIINFSKFW